MKCDIRMVAVDIDGTFVRSDYSYNVSRFRHIFSRMEAVGCRFVVASGNQYFQLRDLFPDWAGKMGFVAEDGVLVTLEKLLGMQGSDTVPSEGQRAAENE